MRNGNIWSDGQELGDYSVQEIDLIQIALKIGQRSTGGHFIQECSGV
jgi:hypothetical protein